jgi:SAM-dependent methyltransferase
MEVSVGLAEHYDNLYANHSNASGEQVSRELAYGLCFISEPGAALDIGCGSGRNTAHLAVCGFEVEAIDLSRVAIEQLVRESARYPQLKVTARVADIVQEGIQKTYKVIVCSQVLHHLLRAQATELIKAMQDNTEVGGLNTISAYTKDGDYFRSKPETENFYLDQGELSDLYKGWDIKLCVEQKGRAFSGGSNITAYIAAVKTS